MPSQVPRPQEQHTQDLENNTYFNMSSVTALAMLNVLPLTCCMTGAVQLCPHHCLCYEQSDLVDCNSRGLTHIPHGIPHGTWLLDLSGNRLTELRSSLFTGLWSLRILMLSNNSLQALQPQALSSLTFLERLDLSYNLLRWLPPDFSQSLSSLWELQLDHNLLEHLNAPSLAQLENLRKLDLSYNRISDVDAGAFRGLPRLRHLDLRGNRLRVLREGVLSRQQGLEVLQLGHNHISQVDTEALAPLRSLILLGLEGNQLRHLKFQTFLNLLTVSTHMQLALNPWTCDCELHRVFSKILHVRRLHVDDYENITCQEPPQIEGVSLAWMDSKLCMAETAIVLVISGTVMFTVIGALTMAERNRKKKAQAMNELVDSQEQENK